MGPHTAPWETIQGICPDTEGRNPRTRDEGNGKDAGTLREDGRPSTGKGCDNTGVCIRGRTFPLGEAPPIRGPLPRRYAGLWR